MTSSLRQRQEPVCRRFDAFLPHLTAPDPSPTVAPFENKSVTYYVTLSQTPAPRPVPRNRYSASSRKAPPRTARLAKCHVLRDTFPLAPKRDGRDLVEQKPLPRPPLFLFLRQRWPSFRRPATTSSASASPRLRFPMP